MIKRKKILYIILLVCVFNTKATTNPFILIDSNSLAKSKELIKNGTASEQTLVAYKKLFNKYRIMFSCLFVYLLTLN